MLYLSYHCNKDIFITYGEKEMLQNIKHFSEWYWHLDIYANLQSNVDNLVKCYFYPEYMYS